ncbi:unnamed protein product, partial [Allacma fusca]
ELRLNNRFDRNGNTIYDYESKGKRRKIKECDQTLENTFVDYSFPYSLFGLINGGSALSQNYISAD